MDFEGNRPRQNRNGNVISFTGVRENAYNERRFSAFAQALRLP